MIKARNRYPSVYLIQCGEYYKIGYAEKPIKRARSFKTGNPFTFTLVHSLETPHYKEVEKQLHYRFGVQRHRGEWFTLSDEDVAYIKSLDKYGKTPEERAASNAHYAAQQAQMSAERDERCRAEARAAIAVVAGV